jgi:hypothetical protein
MSDFSKTQLRKLTGKLDRRHVQSREVEGRAVDYIEGWFAIAQANAIFGFSGWDREMTHFERIYERSRGDVTSCAYAARVRIRVRTGRTTILREGSGCGSATCNTSGEAHDMALKAAETDATKRALATFGNPFGLGLYDKEQNGVTAKKTAGAKSFILYDPTGAPFAQNLSAEGFCTGLRQLIESVSVPDELEALTRCNKEGVSRLRSEAPNLKTAKKIHYADIVERLIQDRLASPSPPFEANGHEDHHAREPTPSASMRAAPPVPPFPPPLPLRPSKIARGARIDKSLLPIGTERRLRNKAHLMFVATHPCVVCGRQPSQAHHLTFCQKRGLSLKVSDEFTVPLCAVHHDELHRGGPEQGWWQAKGIDPQPIAAELWGKSRVPSRLGLEPAAALQAAHPPASQSSANGKDEAPQTQAQRKWTIERDP